MSKLCHLSVLAQFSGTVFRQQAAEEAQSAARLDKEGCMEYNVTEITVINTHCHGELDVEPVYLDKMIRCCEGILDRTIRPGTALNSAGAVERAFWFEDVAVFH